MTTKDKKIIEDSEAKGIPIFVLTAKDKLSLETIKFYKELCIKVECSTEHIRGVGLRVNEFDYWQDFHSADVKIPD